MITEQRCHLFWAPVAIPLALLGVAVLAAATAFDHLHQRSPRARTR